jgi:hypothetical protein
MSSNIMVTKKYINKKGEEILYEYNQQKYAKKCYEKNKEKYCERIECECGGKYLRINKSHHCKSKKHQKFLSQSI